MLFVSTSFPSDSGDWKGLFIRHLVSALARAPKISLRLWAPPGDVPSNVAIATTGPEATWLASLMAKGGIAHMMRSGGLAAIQAPLRLLRMLSAMYRRNATVAVYHVNWLQCALPMPYDRKPALISVLGNDMKLLRLPFMKSLLRRAMRGRRVIICPNADWMTPSLTEAFGTVATVQVVSFGIDPCWYEVERTNAPEAEKIWLAVTRLTRDKLGPLLEWSEPLFRDQRRELHLFGPMQESIALPEWIHYHGAATPAELCETWFPKAQGLISLSRHAEGRPQVMLEAMAAGLPIVASRMPAHSDLVDSGMTGFLCDSRDTFHEAIAQLEGAELNARFGVAAREWVRKEVGTWDDCAARYIRLYRKLLEGQIGG